MQTVKDMIAALIATDASERPETMLEDLSGAIATDEAVYATAADEMAGQLAQALETVEALTKRVQELTAHNYELMKSVGSEPAADTVNTEDDDDYDNPIDSLFDEE